MALVAVPAVSKVLLVTFVPSFVTGSTVRRLRGTFHIEGGVGAIFFGAVGSYVANDTAVAAGIASLADPVTDVGDDVWFWYQSFGGNAGLSGSAGAQAAQTVPIDNKAMRRVASGTSVVFVVANASAAAMSCAISVRLLGSESS